MKSYVYRMICAILTFSIGVVATQLMIAVRYRSQNKLTISSRKEQIRQWNSASRERLWPEPRCLDAELIDADKLAYDSFLVKRRYKTVKVDDWSSAEKRATIANVEVSYATLAQNGKVLARFDNGLYHPMGNSTTFGLFSLLGVHTKQFVIAQSILRGGSHWVVNLAPRFQVVFSSHEWQVGSENICVLDVDHDGIEEILRSVTAFYDFQDKLAMSQIPFPAVIFKYDAQAGKYLPANILHKDYLLRDIEESKNQISEATSDRFSYLSDVLNITLRFVYAGEDQQGWEFYDKVYQLHDKEEIRMRVMNILKEEPVYQFIYHNRRDLKQTAEISLPANMKSALDRRFAAWRYLQIDDEVRQFLHEEVSKCARPEIISGDFDGNGLSDYALLIEATQKATAEIQGARLVVFLTKQRGFDTKVLDPEGAYLVLLRRGDWDYNYETQEYFTYQNDAIFTGIFEKGGASYTYEKGRFRSIITSD